jgi:hypothetical protein
MIDQAMRSAERWLPALCGDEAAGGDQPRRERTSD